MAALADVVEASHKATSQLTAISVVSAVERKLNQRGYSGSAAGAKREVPMIVIYAVLADILEEQA